MNTPEAARTSGARRVKKLPAAVGKARAEAKEKPKSAYAAQHPDPTKPPILSAQDANTPGTRTNSATRLWTSMGMLSNPTNRPRPQKVLALGASPERAKLTRPKYTKTTELTKDSSTLNQKAANKAKST